MKTTQVITEIPDYSVDLQRPGVMLDIVEEMKEGKDKREIHWEMVISLPHSKWTKDLAFKFVEHWLAEQKKDAKVKDYAEELVRRKEYLKTILMNKLDNVDFIGVISEYNLAPTLKDVKERTSDVE